MAARQEQVDEGRVLDSHSASELQCTCLVHASATRLHQDTRLLQCTTDHTVRTLAACRVAIIGRSVPFSAVSSSPSRSSAGLLRACAELATTAAAAAAPAAAPPAAAGPAAAAGAASRGAAAAAGCCCTCCCCRGCVAACAAGCAAIGVGRGTEAAAAPADGGRAAAAALPAVCFATAFEALRAALSSSACSCAKVLPPMSGGPEGSASMGATPLLLPAPPAQAGAAGAALGTNCRAAAPLPLPLGPAPLPRPRPPLGAEAARVRCPPSSLLRNRAHSSAACFLVSSCCGAWGWGRRQMSEQADARSAKAYYSHKAACCLASSCCGQVGGRETAGAGRAARRWNRGRSLATSFTPCLANRRPACISTRDGCW